MAGYNLDESRADGEAGHITDTNAVHDIVNKFDKDASPGHRAAWLYDSVTGVYVPRVGAGSGIANVRTLSYTLALTDAFGIVTMNSGSARTITCPDASSVAFPIGTVVFLFQSNTGTVTVQASGSAVLRSRDSAYQLGGQYAEASVRLHNTNEWVLAGDVVV